MGQFVVVGKPVPIPATTFCGRNVMMMLRSPAGRWSTAAYRRLDMTGSGGTDDNEVHALRSGRGDCATRAFKILT